MINIDLCVGYGAKRRAYDPDYEHVESSKYREYERLEGEGYDESIKDPEDKRVRNIKVYFLSYLKFKKKILCSCYYHYHRSMFCCSLECQN